MNTSKRLKQARQKMRFTQIDVMKKTGINNKTLSGYENGVSEPDLDSLKKLADLYQISLDELITGSRKEDLVNQHDLNVYKTRKNYYYRKESLTKEIKQLLQALSIGNYFLKSVEQEIYIMFEGNMYFEPYDMFDQFYKQYLLTKEDEPEYVDEELEEDFTNHYNYSTVLTAILNSDNDDWKEEIAVKLLDLVNKKGLSLHKADEISKSLEKDLSVFLDQVDVSYKGHKINKQELRLIRVYLETLFNDKEQEEK